MSFSFSFTARNVASARSKLRDQYAPEGVKALIELALAGIREPVQLAFTRSQETAGGNPTGNATKTEAPRHSPLMGIFVEAWGHIDEGGGRSNIDRFLVQPLYD